MENLKELKAITSPYTLLYAEDDRSIADAFINYLSKFFKEVVYVENGLDGLEMYKQQKFDLVITDIKMPKMSGLQMSQEIKKINKEQNILIVSAYSSTDIFLSSIKIGIDGYLVKPINYSDMNELLYKICTKIKKYKENDENQKVQQKLLNQITQKNHELTQYLDVLDHVAIVTKTDLEGVITYANDFFCEITGYKKEELIGQTHNIVRHEDMPKSIYEDMWNTIQEGKVWSGTIKNKKKNGEPYYVFSTIMPLFDENQNITDYIAVRFLTTKEEEEKREFKKRVMTSYSEFKKDNYNSHKQIELLTEKIKTLAIVNDRHNQYINEQKEKIRQLKTQINFYEKEIQNKEDNYHRTIESTSENSKNINDLYKKAQVKIDAQEKEIEFLQKDLDLKKKELHKIEDELFEQRKIIREFRDSLDTKTYSQKEEETKKGRLKNILNRFL